MGMVEDALAEAMRPMQGCDGWVTQDARGWFCADAPASFTDEVTGEAFCRDHAGPLAWSNRDVNLYSAALRIGGYLDRPVALPGMRAA